MKKKNNKNKFLKLIFFVLLFSFVTIYFSELTGYYEYKNYKNTSLTHEQIQKFETDVKNGKEVDIKQYIKKDETKYDSKLSRATAHVSETISNTVKYGIEKTFKYLSKMIDE